MTDVRQMSLVGFMQAGNATVYAGLLAPPRHRARLPRRDYYQIGRALEEGKFHLAFFDDRLAMPDFYGGRSPRPCASASAP